MSPLARSSTTVAKGVGVAGLRGPTQPIWVVIPCFESSESLVGVVKECHDVLGAKAEFAGVILVVDGPQESTEDIAKRALIPFPHDVLIVLARNVGQHAATLAGIEAVGPGIVLTDRKSVV